MNKNVNFCGLNEAIVLDRVEAYDASALNCYAFRRGTDMVGGLSLSLGNMVSGFPFDLDGVRFHNSECAYIAGMFSEDSEEHGKLQKELVEESNGFMAKKRIRRKNEDLKREDWEEFNINWMMYVVWNKVRGNEKFRKILMSIPEDGIIIEDSTFQNGKTATIWGTKNKEMKKLINEYKKDLKLKGSGKKMIKDKCDEMRLGECRKSGIFEGKNLMGKILMLCRDSLKNVGVPPIDFELLRSKNIHLLGNKITFENH